ncbi:MAG TPA: DNRLRE domain-containing protein [Planctomycetota bacterium]|nr:DNRLRE domain-containing protein [Planctomycetota bacterium]
MTRLQIVLALSLALLVGLCAQAATTTLTFQQGASDYAGAGDGGLNRASPDTNYATAATFDIQDATGPNTFQALIRFDDIIGSDAGRVPVGSRIQSATLSLFISNVTTTDLAYVHRMLTTWSDTATWNSMANGVDEAGIEYVTQPDAAKRPNSVNFAYDIDVTAGVQAWADAPSTNFGWVILPGGPNTWRICTANNGTAANRPKLTIVFESASVLRSFTVSDQATGNTAYTPSATVNVSMVASTIPDQTVTGYMVTETETAPDPGSLDWSATPVTSYTITGGEGPVTLYGAGPWTAPMWLSARRPRSCIHPIRLILPPAT